MRLLSGLVLAVLARADDGATVYHGKLDGAKSPGEVVAATVFDKIPEYKQIKEKGLGPDDAEYWTLLSKANEKFYAAVKKVAEQDKYDVVVEKGSAGLQNAPDITQKVIDALPQ